MTARRMEIAFLTIIALTLLVGGQPLLFAIARFHTLAVATLLVLALVVLMGFRRNFLAAGPNARLNSARDGALLAAIASAISFVIVAAKWSLGAAIVAAEIAVVVEILTCLRPNGSVS